MNQSGFCIIFNALHVASEQLILAVQAYLIDLGMCHEAEDESEFEEEMKLLQELFRDE